MTAAEKDPVPPADDERDNERDDRRDDERDVVTAAEGARLLGVKPATLYAYVSRGLLRARGSPGSRLKRYARADVLRLKARADARRGHDAAAKDALDWGAPVIESAITGISPEGPRYRGVLPSWFWETDNDDDGDPFGHAAHWLVRGHHAPPRSFRIEGAPFGAYADREIERYAVDDDDDAAWLDEDLKSITHCVRRLAWARPPLSLMACLDLVLTGWRLAGPAGVLDERAEWHKGRALLGHLCAAGWLMRDARAFPGAASVLPGRAVPGALGLSDDADPLLRRMLIVIADHELNASTFAARVASSTSATLAGCLSAALAVVSGPRHGAACDRIEALIDDVERARPAGHGGLAAQARAVVGARLTRGEPMLGFGHRLYPQGDPRAQWLLSFPGVKESPATASIFALIEVWRSLGGDNALTAPAVDLALVACCRALGLPAGSATALFATGRSAGWIAHVAEQRLSPTQLRPRARYTGP
jgi:citrate synthase